MVAKIKEAFGGNMADKTIAVLGLTFKPETDAIVLLTEWNEYRGMNLKNALELMNGNVFVDLYNAYVPGPMRAMGLQYSCVGRQPYSTSPMISGSN
jgi:UDP-glucose 6-dehydrogenase